MVGLIYTKFCFKTLQTNDLVWFQYRIIHRILEVYLKKLNICATSSCNICNISEETLLHLFTSCSVVIHFWNCFKTCLQQTFSLYLEVIPQLTRPSNFSGRFKNSFAFKTYHNRVNTNVCIIDLFAHGFDDFSMDLCSMYLNQVAEL